MSTTPVDAAGVGPAPLAERLRPHLTGWLFALPFLVIFLVFLAIPILASFLLSFTGFGIANLRDWFKALYQILLGQEQGPRMGSFIALYGVPESIRLIDRALAGESLA